MCCVIFLRDAQNLQFLNNLIGLRYQTSFYYTGNLWLYSNRRKKVKSYLILSQFILNIIFDKSIIFFSSVELNVPTFYIKELVQGLFFTELAPRRWFKESRCPSFCLWFCLWQFKTPSSGGHGDFWWNGVSLIMACDETIFSFFSSHYVY